jgi:hypothetical protein
MSFFWKEMMMFRCLLALMPLAAVFGSVNEPIRWEWQTGYRNDNLHWHLENPGDDNELSYSEHYRDLQFWENALTVQVIHRDIALFVRGAGAFGSGPLKQRFSGLNFTAEEPQLKFNTDVWTMDGWGYFGYSVNLTADRVYKSILLPFVGVSVNYEHLSRQGSHTAEGLAAGAASDTFSMESSLPGAEQTTWYGPLLGGLFLIQPGGPMQFEAGYAYRRLHLRFKTKYATEVSLYSGGNLISVTDKLESFKVKDGSNIGQMGWARLEYVVSRAWRLGLFAQIQYFTSRVLDVTLKNKITGSETPQKYKIRWTTVSGEATVSRTF